MVTAAEGAVEPLTNVVVTETRRCDVQELPFADGAFDVAVANHMLYHVPDPRLAAAELARVLRPGGVLLAATNGPRHLETIAQLSRQALGWSPLDSSHRRFGKSTGEAILAGRFGSVRWDQHPSTMVCTNPDDVIAFIVSGAAGQEASADQRRALNDAVAARFHQNGGVLRITTDSGCFVAR
jgi:SAM-dependent methyltransferase